MAVGKQKRRTEGVVKSQANLQKLLIKGRVTIDPATNMPKMPRRNVLYMDTVPGTNRPREVNGGHAKADNSVWRTALGGPARYIWKILHDELTYRIKNTRSISAPSLVVEEMQEAREFVTCLLEKGITLPDDFLNSKHDYDQKTRELFRELDKQFYAWKGTKEKVELAKITDVFAFLPL